MSVQSLHSCILLVVAASQAAGLEVEGAGKGASPQQRRTREAILAATKQLIAAGETPSINEVAEAAEVSRRTVYMHFSSLDHLLIDATSGLLSERTVEPALDPEIVGDDPFDRVDALARALVNVAPDTLPLGRRLLRLTVEAPASPGTTCRGYRRISWIERAIENLRPQLNAEQFQRLVAGLAVVLGWESMIVLRDICGLDPAEEERVMRWAAAALVADITREALSTPRKWTEAKTSRG